MSRQRYRAGERPRIVFVMGSYSLGGAERQLAALIERRPASVREVELHTVTLHRTRSPETAARFDGQGVVNTLVDWDALPFPLFLLRLLRVLRRLRPDIVHTVLDGSSGTWGRLGAFLTRVPVIIHSDRSLEPASNRSDRPLRPFLDRVTTRFLPNARAIAERVQRTTGVPPEKILVMPNGVDLSQFAPDRVRGRRGDWGVPDGALVAGFLGRFERVKRIDVLLDALLSLPVEARPDHLLLAGDGSLMPSLRQRVAADPWLAERCHLLGAQQDVPAFLASIDYLVQPSEVEGLPNAVLEAMAMGRPVVATRVSDVPLLVEGAGRVAEAGDVASLAAALRSMQDAGADELARLGRAARRRIELEYDLDRVAERFWNAHLELLPVRDGGARPASGPAERAAAPGPDA